MLQLWKRCPKLRFLHIDARANLLKEPGAKSLASALALRLGDSLEELHLNLSDNALGDRGARHIGAALAQARQRLAAADRKLEQEPRGAIAHARLETLLVARPQIDRDERHHVAHLRMAVRAVPGPGRAGHGREHHVDHLAAERGPWVEPLSQIR